MKLNGMPQNEFDAAFAGMGNHPAIRAVLEVIRLEIEELTGVVGDSRLPDRARLDAAAGAAALADLQRNLMQRFNVLH